VTIEDKVVQLEVWDTNGEEAFYSISPAFYRGADCVFFIYDVNKYITLYTNWLREIKKHLLSDEIFITPN
jgi:Ras-related protein Rab-1A